MAGYAGDRRPILSGEFSGPHVVAADATGNIYVVEKITGGRIITICKVEERSSQS